MNTIQDAQNALLPILNVMFAINDYLLLAIIIIMIFFKKESKWFHYAFHFSGISLVIFLSSFMVQDQYLMDVNNTPRFAMYMIIIGMLSVLFYLFYWISEIFSLSNTNNEKQKGD